MRLKDKVAIITGSGRGLGREAAILFAQEKGIAFALHSHEEGNPHVIVPLLDKLLEMGKNNREG